MSTDSGARLIVTLSELLADNPPDGAGGFEAAQIHDLLKIYFRHIDPGDLDERDPHDLLGALIAHWRLMRQRRPDEAKVRVYNPNEEDYGWRSRDTIVEVVAGDMPFLVDSISAALNRRGMAIKLTIHPVFAVTRDAGGLLTRITRPTQGDGVVADEAVIQLHVDRQPAEALDALARLVRSVIDDVQRTTADWLQMRHVAETLRDGLADVPARASQFDAEEMQAFLSWMINDHFLFVATCRFDLDPADRQAALMFADDSGLGVLRDGEGAHELATRWISGLGVDLSAFDSELLITKADARSTIHRPAYLDCVAIKHRNPAGEVDGVSCLIGLFSSSAYSTPPRQIPILRRKVELVFAATEVSPRSHSGRVVTNILDNFPRDALFQAGRDDLLATTLGVLSLQERQRTRLFMIRDPFRRFVSCLVYIPRERYSREVRLAIQQLLMVRLDGSDVVFDTYFSESILARITFLIWMPAGAEPDVDSDDLERQIIDLTTTWQDGLRDALYGQVDEALATRYLHAYAHAFPSGYRDDFHPRIAVGDIERIERARRDDGLALHLYQPIDEASAALHVRLYSPRHPVALSQAIPILENMGLSVHGERPYRIRHPAGEVWIHDFATRQTGAADAGLGDARREAFASAFLRAWAGAIDNDGFNGLILRAAISWREALVFRAYSRYLHQIKAPYTQDYVVAVLNRHPDVVQVLNHVFRLRFDPAADGDAATTDAAAEKFEQCLEAVSSLEEDRILRSFLHLIQATLRTNFFRDDCAAAAVPYLSFKFDPTRVPGMPQPRPMFEIFVFSADMEGVHLRGGRVARGGLRWSDRMEDYRTEILGLMKAQMVKNTVIVPAGSKGGFIVKRGIDTDDRERLMQQVVACYQTLLRGMLDLTDNLVGNRPLPPPGVVRHDDDDPYLVIAADKGTATFSDIANRVSADYAFWLGDAFASGGSAGYDHKAMGITARGAWESVKRNFRELGLDTQNEPFSVVGIGDMSGDVFGNGMLLSPHIRLVAAFNHRHIFIDPDPDAGRAFAERQRLFALPRSGWADYDRNLISAGGDVYSRDAKSLPLTAEIRALLGLDVDRITPNALIQAILRAPVDLLWNGGIGTYVKASHESHAQASDKANDGVRVDATELRCRVVGEGGNLGFTQLARIEYALGGGQIYTDAIDNSAGVDCSDHEVNIKILLDQLVADGDLTTKQRNQLLVDMTDDVAALVLADNYAQTRAISVVAAAGADRLYEQARFIELLEQKGGFDRALEGLPDRKAITERQAAGKGLSKPEISVLLAYSKMNYYEAVVESTVPDDPYVRERLVRYFPPQLRERYPAQISGHPLRREIVATAIAREVVDHVGPGIGFRVREQTGCDIADVARAYLVVSDIFATDRLCAQIESLDNQVAARVQIDMLTALAGFLEHTLTGLLRAYRRCLDMQTLSERFRSGVTELWDALPRPLATKDKADFNRRARQFGAAGVPLDIAKSVAGLAPMAAALDIVDVARATDSDIAATAWVHSALNHQLELDWTRRQIAALGVHTHWHLLARTKLAAALDRQQRDLTEAVLRCPRKAASPRGILEQWSQQNRAMLDRHAQLVAELKAGKVFDFAILSLAVAAVDELLPRDVDGDGDGDGR
ncbi:MAG: NAD-glutamate dehydrogenase [Gammaproteobacteria bacterium]|nr:NAD-glutamate dehydrogenase [Gammaproteobacteria bacterium]